ncbi:MAG: carbamate kinase [Candidatus Micrarchaeota archaeon]|nr:carbamate kinase [Candidatus Micrarchaeota archaeon]
MINVVAIGGNALDSSKNLDSVLEAIYMLSKRGKVVITHGNGPQVGALSDLEKGILGTLTAQTEAQIGLRLEEELIKYFKKRGRAVKVETLLTRVLVDPKDPAFKSPSKPIGKFYSREQASKLGLKRLKKLAKGYRRVVPSPKPLEILNLDSIKDLLSKNYIVIAGGGGGVPIFYNGMRFNFADAVLDKDYTSALIAKSIGAQGLFILTNVNGAYLNFGKKGKILLRKVGAAELFAYSKEGAFEEGSMQPKVKACMEFVWFARRRAAIGGMKNATDVINFKNCTTIIP